jgi:hypothetical protein
LILLIDVDRQTGVDRLARTDRQVMIKGIGVEGGSNSGSF